MNNLNLEFAQHQSQDAIAKLVAHPDYSSIESTINEVLESQVHIAYCEEHQGKMYHLLQNNEYPKGIYRVCDTKYYQAGIPNWSPVFSIAEFDALLNDDVYLDGCLHYVEHPERILLNLSSQGKDSHYTLEFDIPSKKVISKGFNFRLGKSFVHWRDLDSVWVGPAWEACQMTISGYPKQVWLQKRGQNLSEAELVFEGKDEDIFVEAWRYLDSHGSPLDMIKQSHSFYQFSYYVVQKDNRVLRLKLPDSCEVCGYLNGYLLVHLKEDWHRTKHSFTAGSVIAIKLQQGQLKHSISLFSPTNYQVVETIETSKDYIFIHYLDQVYSKAKVYLFKNDSITPVAFPELSTINFELIDQPWRTNIFYLVANDLIHEPVLYAFDAERAHLTVLRQQAPLFNTENLSVEQYTATSQDGTCIPYFWCGSQTTATPTLVYCYGGFAVNELPHYIPIIGKLWLEQGFSFVIANIRGGAELGEDWHQQAILHNKHKSVEDLIAVIEDLQYQQKTTPQMTAIQGASNGGLIVANAMATIPEKLQAVICEVPIIDLPHYTEYASGNLWRAEYGNPEDEHTRTYLETLNILNKITPHHHYPELLITTNLADDRVDPSHAILLQKKMQENAQQSYLICQEKGGHESLASQDSTIDELVYLWLFLYNALNLNFNSNLATETLV